MKEHPKHPIGAQKSPIPTPDELGFDPAAIRRKYDEERAKRMRPDGNAQYLEAKGELAHYDDVDPYVEPGFTRPAMDEELDVVVIGGGFGGQLAAIRLGQAGVTDVRIIERAGDFGGTWYWNRYPGAQCDIESYVYLPLLEETGYMPKERYSFAPEILEHAKRIGRHFGLYERACFQTKVTEMRWNAETGRWKIRTDRGDVFRARYVVTALGPLNRPKLPGIPGIETFRGHAFHTCRWDYEYTGGDSSGNLHKLADKRVGIIGTGATAVQCVVHVGASAEQLYVFQRTPSSVDERGNAPTDPEWVKSLEPGWQQERTDNFNKLLSGIPVEIDMVADGWTRALSYHEDLMRRIEDPSSLTPEETEALAEIADHQHMEYIRKRVERLVDDRETAEALKPWYGQGCKRPTFNDGYLPTFNRPNVKLVDTNGKGVERVTENAVIVDGVAYEVDCLIFGSGFEVGTKLARQGQFEAYGRDGVSTSEAWGTGRRTLHGLLSHGFPNWFHVGLRQTGASLSLTYTYDTQVLHIAYLVAEQLARNAEAIEATAEAERAWLDLVNQPGPLQEYQKRCTPGFWNSEGKLDGNGFFDELYPDGPVRFREMLEELRNRGDFQGLTIARASD